MSENSHYWPTYLPEKLLYCHGERPLHEYIQRHATNKPNEIAYSFYGRDITWQELNDSINRLASACGISR
jgi:long-chain acyl-CoA synthetase